MRATVGPLPPAVYWRRRAVVLGGLLLGVIVLFVSCTGGNKADKLGRGTASSVSPTPGPATSTPDDDPSFSDAAPGAGPSLPSETELAPQPSDVTGAGTGATTGPNVNVTAPADGSCADAEMAVTPVPALTTLRRGQSVAVRLAIKNVSARTCTRDVGADLQELYIEQGARRIWSSDTCSDTHGSDVERFVPGAERVYAVTWNGRQVSKCAGGLAAGPAPPPGSYAVRGRLGAKVSAPVTVTIVA
jgi:hypothetical protein